MIFIDFPYYTISAVLLNVLVTTASFLRRPQCIVSVKAIHLLGSQTDEKCGRGIDTIQGGLYIHKVLFSTKELPVLVICYFLFEFDLFPCGSLYLWMLFAWESRLG